MIFLFYFILIHYSEKKKQKLINKKKLLSTLVCKRRKTLMNKTREMHEISGAECLLVIASKTGSVYHYSSPGFKPVVESNLLKEKCSDIVFDNYN